MRNAEVMLEQEIAELVNYISNLELDIRLGLPVDCREVEWTKDLIEIKLMDMAMAEVM